jgi:hypothetical protein
VRRRQGPARDGDAELDAPVGERLAQRLRVGVRNDELHAFERGADHVVDGVSARATDTDDGNPPAFSYLYVYSLWDLPYPAQHIA